MTSYNLKTLQGVSAFQAEWDARMEQYSLVKKIELVPVVYNTAVKFKLDNFSFVYVDNNKNIFLPVFRFDFKVYDFILTQHSETDLRASLEVKANYNNSRTAKWEPFIEPFNLDLMLKKTEDATSLHVAGGLEGSSEGLYMNVSEELLEASLNCLNNANSVINMQDIEVTNEEEMTIYDSQFLIRNKTGYSIFIQTVGDRVGQKTKIKNMSEKFVNFIINDEFSTRETANREVVLELGTHCEEDANDVPRSEQLTFSVEKVQQFEHLVNGHPIVITVKKERLKRVAVISSKMLFVNLTQQPVTYMLFSPEGQFENTQISFEQQRYPIKFDMTQEFISLGLGDALSPKISLQELVKKKNQSFKIPLVCPQEKYNNLHLDVYQKRNLVFFDFKPSLRIVNNLPLELSFHAIHKKMSEAGKLQKTQFVEIFKFDPYKDQTLLAIQVARYRAEIEVTKLLRSDGFKQVVMSHMDNPLLRFTLDLHHHRPTNELRFFVRFVVLNETGLCFDFASADAKTSRKRQPLPDCAGFEDSIYFLPEKKNNVIFIQHNPQTFSSFPRPPTGLDSDRVVRVDRNIAYSINERLFCIVDQKPVEFDFTFIPTVLELAPRIFTKTLTVAPKHIFINDTDFSLNVIQMNSSRSSPSEHHLDHRPQDAHADALEVR